jgi:hypothetical protein
MSLLHTPRYAGGSLQRASTCMRPDIVAALTAPAEACKLSPPWRLHAHLGHQRSRQGYRRSQAAAHDDGLAILVAHLPPYLLPQLRRVVRGTNVRV